VEKIKWLYSVRAEFGPTAALEGEQAVDAYEKISVTLAAGATQDVTVAPGKWTGVRVLIITASDLKGTVTVAVKPNGPAAALVLDAPFVLLGAGAVSLLGNGDAITTLHNTGALAVSVDLFVARDATP
jgi:hypothetical protein